MKIVALAFKYLKKYPLISACALFSVIVASLFEGVSFGILIPLIQTMTGAGSDIFQKTALAGLLTRFFALSDQAGQISLIMAALFLVLLVKNAFVYTSNMLIARLRFGVSRDMSIRLMERLIDYDMRYYDVSRTGYLMSGVVTETRRIGDFTLSVLNLLAVMARVAAYIALLFVISWKTSLVVFVMIAGVLLPLEFVMKRLKKISAQVSRAYAEFNSRIADIIAGIRLIKSAGTEAEEKSGFRAYADNLFRFQYKSNKYIFLLIPVSEVVIFALIVSGLIIMVNYIKIDIKRAFPLIATYLLVLVRTLTHVNLLNSVRSGAVSNVAAVESCEEMCDMRGKKTIEGGRVVIDRFKDAIEFIGVDFCYAGDRQVLKDININIPKGRVTAIAGVSGVGKSTIVNLIMRFYDISSGKIVVDGVDIKKLELSRWRRKIGFVSQDIFLFNSTVKDNIAYGHSASMDKITAAARAAGAHDFIVGLPDGYGTVLGERGVRLSGGQKQRISIARAIIHDPEILILDEATSSLDTQTERLIKGAVERLAKDRTVIAIAHRLSTIVHADNIIVLHDGRVEDSGDHLALLKRGGLYRRLYEAQFAHQAAELPEGNRI